MAGQTIVVGAGAAGLAVAAILQRRGAAYAVLEQADAVGAAWRGRYDGLRLHTARWLSGLPGVAIPRRFGLWVHRDDFVAYLEDYAQRFEIRPELGVAVTRIERASGGWRVDTSTGSRYAETVVVATGFTRTPNRPDWPGLDTFPGSVIHSTDYREPSAYAGQRVLVVGAGNSATEIAVEIAAVAAQVQVAVRTPPNIVRRATLGIPSQVIAVLLARLPAPALDRIIGVVRRLTVPDLAALGLPAPPGDAYAQFVRSQTSPILDHGFVDAVREGRITIVPAVESVSGPEVQHVGGTVTRPDSIIAATGYRPDLTAIVGDLGVLDESGQPRVHGTQTLPGAPGLYFVGITVEFAGQLREIAREARQVGEAVSAG